MPSTCWIVNTRRGESALALSDWACVQGSREHRGKSIWSAHSECSASGPNPVLCFCFGIIYIYIYVCFIICKHNIHHCCCCVASVVSDSVRPHRRPPTRLPCPWDSPGKNTGLGCRFLLQCIKVKVKSLSRVRLLATPWNTHHYDIINPLTSLPMFLVRKSRRRKAKTRVQG